MTTNPSFYTFKKEKKIKRRMEHEKVQEKEDIKNKINKFNRTKKNPSHRKNRKKPVKKCGDKNVNQKSRNKFAVWVVGGVNVGLFFGCEK